MDCILLLLFYTLNFCGNGKRWRVNRFDRPIPMKFSYRLKTQIRFYMITLANSFISLNDAHLFDRKRYTRI